MVISGAERIWGRVLKTIVATAYVFMLAPIAVVVIAAFNDAELMVFPPTTWSLRWFRELPQAHDFIVSFKLSAWLGLATAVVSTVLGSLAAYGLVRHGRRRQAGVETLLLAPLYVPRVLIGMALLLSLSLVAMAGTFSGMLIAHVLITVPFVIRTVTASLHGVDPAVEEAARVLGATWRQAFMLVTLPLVRSGVIAGAVFAFVISFTDVYLAIFLSGPTTITLPLRIFNFLEWEQTPIVAAISSVQLLFIVVVILLAEKAVGLSTAGRI